MCMKRETPSTRGSRQFLGMSRRRSTIRSFNGFIQRIRRRQFVVEKLSKLLVGTLRSFETSPLENCREPSLRAPEEVADQLFDGACRVLPAFSCHLVRVCRRAS